ncbi:hypothetical protein R6Q59_029217 [Mikania micrantha]
MDIVEVTDPELPLILPSEVILAILQQQKPLALPQEEASCDWTPNGWFPLLGVQPLAFWAFFSSILVLAISAQKLTYITFCLEVCLLSFGPKTWLSLNVPLPQPLLVSDLNRTERLAVGDGGGLLAVAFLVHFERLCDLFISPMELDVQGYVVDTILNATENDWIAALLVCFPASIILLNWYLLFPLYGILCCLDWNFVPSGLMPSVL